jgi:hypothetical protein
LAVFVNGEYRTNILKNVFGVQLVEKPDGTGKTYVKIETAQTAQPENANPNQVPFEVITPLVAEDGEPVGEDGLPF